MELFFFGVFAGIILALIMLLIEGLIKNEDDDRELLDGDNNCYFFFLDRDGRRRSDITPTIRTETVEEGINVLNVIKNLLTRHEKETIEEIVDYLEDQIEEKE